MLLKQVCGFIELLFNLLLVCSKMDGCEARVHNVFVVLSDFKPLKCYQSQYIVQ